MPLLKFIALFGLHFSPASNEKAILYAPTVSVAQVSAAGVSGIRTMLLPQGSIVEGVIMAYSVAVQHVFFIVAATATVAFVCSWGLGWQSVRKAEPIASEA